MKTLRNFELRCVLYLTFLVSVDHFSRLVASTSVANILLTSSQFCSTSRNQQNMKQSLNSSDGDLEWRLRAEPSLFRRYKFQLEASLDSE